MADPVETVVTEIVAKCCSATECPYRYGDSSGLKKKLGERLLQKIKHRLADGNEVRKLERRIEDLEKVLKMCLVKATLNTTFTVREVGELKKVLNPDKKG